MKQKKAAKILKALAALLLCVPFSLQAATSDDFIQGYASAVLEREFRIKNFSLSVVDEAVRVTSSELSDADHDKVIAALLSIHGVKKVEIVDGRGAVVAASASQQAGTQPAVQGSTKPDYEVGFLPSGKLFEPLIADPRWPRFSLGYRYFPSEARHVGAATFGESIALYRTRGPAGALGEIGFQAGVFSIFTWVRRRRIWSTRTFSLHCRGATGRMTCRLFFESSIRARILATNSFCATESTGLISVSKAWTSSCLTGLLIGCAYMVAAVTCFR